MAEINSAEVVVGRFSLAEGPAVWATAGWFYDPLAESRAVCCFYGVLSFGVWTAVGRGSRLGDVGVVVEERRRGCWSRLLVAGSVCLRRYGVVSSCGVDR